MTTWKTTEGWLDISEVELIQKYVKEVPDFGTILEIGTLNGKSTLAMTEVIKPNVKIVTIDPFVFNKETGFDEKSSFKNILEKSKQHNSIVPIPARTEDIHDSFKNILFDFILIDGLHTLQNLLYDFSVACIYSSPKALIGIHDFFPDRKYFPGVTIGIDLIIKEKIAEVIEQTASLILVKPVKDRVDSIFRMSRPDFTDKYYSFC